MLAGFRKSLRDTAQRFALGGVGALLALVGLGFFSASALMLLVTLTDPVTACAIMGGGFLGLGLIFMAVARPPPAKPRQRAAAAGTASTQDMPPIAAAFMQGMAQGMAQNRRH